jgi:hypothetical protein
MKSALAAVAGARACCGQHRCEILFPVRLSENAARKVAGIAQDIGVTGGKQHAQVRALPFGLAGQVQAIHAAGHDHVSEEKVEMLGIETCDRVGRAMRDTYRIAEGFEPGSGDGA